jgi:amino acid transporter
MPISDVAARYWGRGSLWVTLTAISASLGLAIATAVGASRVLYSMGRDGTAPRLLAQLHLKHGVPSNALHIIFGVGLVASLTSGALIGPYSSYVWWGTTTTFFALATYLLVHLANLILNGRKAFNSLGALVGFLLVPVIGIGVDGYLIVRTFFIELWSQGWPTGRSVIVFDVGCALIAALVAAWTWWRESPPAENLVSTVES